MSKNVVFRVYEDEETMLKVYGRRLRMADVDYQKREPEYKKWVARYRNEVVEDQITDEGHRVNVTNGVGVIDTMFSSLTAVDVEFIVKRLGRATEAQAIAAAKGLNAAMRDTKMQRRAKKAVKDALICDIGWVKVYYDYVTDIETRDRPESAVKAEIEEMLGKDEYKDLSEETVADMVEMTEDVEIVVRDRVCVDYVAYTDIRYDISANQVEDARWIAQYTKLPVPEVTQNPMWREFVIDRYGKAEGERKLDDIEGDSDIRSGMDYSDVEGLGGGSDGSDQDDSRCTVVELWDLETGLVTTFLKDNAELVLYQRPNPLMFNMDLEDRNPFKPLIVRDDPENLEGLGDMRVIHPSLEELDEYRSNIATHVRRSIPKMFGPKDALGAQARKALESDEWMAYVGLEGGHAFAELGQPPIPQLSQEVYAVPEKIQMEMQETTGANEVVRGVFPSKRTTATEAQLVTTGGQARQGERRGSLEQWYIDIARTALQLMQKFYDQERMVRFVAETGQEFEWTWTNEDIAIEADLEIAITPKENLTREERFQRAVFVSNMLAPLPEVDRVGLFQWVLSEAGLDDDLIRTIVKSPEETQADQLAQNSMQGMFQYGASLGAAKGSLRGGSSTGMSR
jgi:hypothetical protein